MRFELCADSVCCYDAMRCLLSRYSFADKYLVVDLLMVVLVFVCMPLAFLALLCRTPAVPPLGSKVLLACLRVLLALLALPDGAR